jgi:hypothetical protein
VTDGWLHLENEETGGTSRIPDDDAVRVWHEARGWRVVEPPAPAPFVPVPAEAEPDGSAWVTLVHPDLPDARHDFPNNPDALAGAAEAGWVEPNKDGSVPSPATAKRARGRRRRPTRRRTWEPHRIPTDPRGTAGSDSEQAESSATTVKE